MSSLLIHDHPLMVLPKLAVAIGLNEAIVLQQIHYWTLKATQADDGHVWVYNSVEQWREQFPFWSADTIARTLKSLRERGVVVAEKRARNVFDKTLYYRIDRELLDSLDTSNLPGSKPQTKVKAKQVAAADTRKLPGSAGADCKPLCTETTQETTEQRNTPHTPQGGTDGSADAQKKKRGTATGLKAWLEAIKAKGEKPVPADDTVFAWAEEVGLPREFLGLAWAEFKSRYCQPDAKRYTDWRSVFRKAIRGNWMRLWYLDGETYVLTTQGQQARKIHKEAA